MAARSKAWVCGRSLAGLPVRTPRRAWISTSSECCVLSDRGLCDGPITSPEESYLCGVYECDLETSTMRRPRLTSAVEPRKKTVSLSFNVGT